MKQKQGQGLIEYVLIIALIAVACVAALRLFGQRMHDNIQNMEESFPEGQE